MREVLTYGQVGLDQPAGTRDSGQLGQAQDMSDLGGGHMEGGVSGEAADDHIVDDEGQAAQSEESYQGLNDANTAGHRSHNL